MILDEFWRYFVRPVLFGLPPEFAHYFSMNAFSLASGLPGVSHFLRRRLWIADQRLQSQVFGLRFPNPIGLAAGFDKDARWLNSLALLGFGAIEVGSVTAQPQPGNAPPRLFRLARDQALINRMGFNNCGSDELAERLRAHAERNVDHRFVIGVNLGKTKTVALDAAAEDYAQSFRVLFPFGDYFVVNVSSPNTPGLRSLQEREPLLKIIGVIQQLNRELSGPLVGPPKPILLKIAPDLIESQLNEIAELVLQMSLNGVIATNTTLSRSNLTTSANRIAKIGDGGLSGKPLFARSLEVVRFLFRRFDGRVPIVGVGGILDGDSAWKMISAGASLVQAYTGFVYFGPGFARSINRFLSDKLESLQLNSISEAIGRDYAKGT